MLAGALMKNDQSGKEKWEKDKDKEIQRIHRRMEISKKPVRSLFLLHSSRKTIMMMEQEKKKIRNKNNKILISTVLLLFST